MYVLVTLISDIEKQTVITKGRLPPLNRKKWQKNHRLIMCYMTETQTVTEEHFFTIWAHSLPVIYARWLQQQIICLITKMFDS